VILLIRHARADERAEWSGDDRRRPLDERGRKQAADLVDALSHYPLTRILLSPYDRCVETVEPLARACGLEIEIRDELGEDTNSRRAWSSYRRATRTPQSASGRREAADPLILILLPS
jgi:broad specificity phosphatase PhoE